MNRASVWRSKELKISAICSWLSRRLRVGKRRHELGAQGLLDLFENFLLHRVERQHPLDDVHRQLFREGGEDLAGVLGVDLAQNDCDGLRVFVLEVGREDVFLNVAQLLPHVAAGGAADFFHDRIDAVGGRKDISSRCVVSELPETVPLAETKITNSAKRQSSISWVIGPMRTMVRDEDLDLHLVELFEDGAAEVGTERQAAERRPSRRPSDRAERRRRR